MPRLHGVLVLALAALLLVAAGCGGSDSEEAEEESISNTEAIAEISMIKDSLDLAVVHVRQGETDEADRTVGDAYLDHFELVEAPLGDRDHDLMEELEEAISTELRNDIKSGEDADSIAASVEDIKADLDHAAEVLQR